MMIVLTGSMHSSEKSNEIAFRGKKANQAHRASCTLQVEYKWELMLFSKVEIVFGESYSTGAQAFSVKRNRDKPMPRAATPATNPTATYLLESDIVPYRGAEE